jgi:hypothetical protein
MSMRNILLTLSLSWCPYVAAAPAAVAGSGGSARTFSAPAPHLTCWYDESGAYTGYAPAPEGAKAGTKTQTAASGAHAWSYTVAGTDPAACPARLPVSTLTEQ